MQIFTLRRPTFQPSAKRCSDRLPGRCEKFQSRPRASMPARVRVLAAAGAAPIPAAIEVLLPAGPLEKIHSAFGTHAWRRWLPCPNGRWAHHDRRRLWPKLPEFPGPFQAGCEPACTAELPSSVGFGDAQHEFSSSVLRSTADREGAIAPQI